MKPITFYHNVQIYYEDTDHSGVVYHPNFLKYFERAREHVIGCEWLKQLWNEQGLGFAVYKANQVFQQGVVFATLGEVRSQVVLEGKYKTIWDQSFWLEGETKPAVKAEIEMVCMDKNKQLRPIPQGLIDQLQTQTA